MSGHTPLRERLRERAGSVPIGSVDGEIIFGDDHDAIEAADTIDDLLEALKDTLARAERHMHHYLGGDSLKRESEELQSARDVIVKAEDR